MRHSGIAGPVRARSESTAYMDAGAIAEMPWMALTLPSMALDTRFPAGMTHLAEVSLYNEK